MKALTWHGKSDVRCESVPDPKIQDGRDAIIKVTACAICGSDLHLFDGIMPTMEKGDVLGHETMGEVVEVGKDNTRLKVGERVVVPFTIACGECFFCKNGFYSGCERSNPNAKQAEKLWGHSPAGLFGYSHMLGGFAGGQAEYMRVPYADVGPYKIPEGLTDEQVLFLSDIFPTGYMAADFSNLKGGETVAVWGCGPVGQFAIKSALLLGAERVIAIDTVPERLARLSRKPPPTTIRSVLSQALVLKRRVTLASSCAKSSTAQWTTAEASVSSPSRIASRAFLLMFSECSLPKGSSPDLRSGFRHFSRTSLKAPLLARSPRNPSSS
jgi:threonine dehydrogenase-like Zn-dependent dehydrogenase